MGAPCRWSPPCDGSTWVLSTFRVTRLRKHSVGTLLGSATLDHFPDERQAALGCEAMPGRGSSQPVPPSRGAENPHTDRHSGPRRPICLSLSAFGRGHSQPCVLEKGRVRRSCPASGSRKVGIRGRQARLRGEAPYDTCLRRVFEFPVFSTYGGFLGTSTRAELHDGLSVYGDRLQKKNWMQTQRAQNSFLPKWVTSMHLSPKYSWSEICVLCIGARGP